MSLRFLLWGALSLALTAVWGVSTGARAELPPGFYPNQALVSGGFTRTYDVQVPASYDGSADVPLVVDLHGWSRTKEWQESQSGFAALSQTEGFIVARTATAACRGGCRAGSTRAPPSRSHRS